MNHITFTSTWIQLSWSEVQLPQFLTVSHSHTETHDHSDGHMLGSAMEVSILVYLVLVCMYIIYIFLYAIQTRTSLVRMVCELIFKF